MKPWLLPALILAVVAAPMGVLTAPTAAVAQAQDGRVLGPAQVRGLRLELATALSQVDQARALAETERRRTAAARADFRRVARIFGLAPDTPATTVAEHLERWAEQDDDNRRRLSDLTEIVARIDSGEVRDAAEHHLQTARAAFDDGRLEDADAALAELEQLRRSHQAEARQLWIDAVIARAALADQRRDHASARRLLREFRAEERALSDHVQWRAVMQEASSYVAEDQWRPDNALLDAAVAVLRDEALVLVDRSREPMRWADTHNSLGNALLNVGRRESDSARLAQAIQAYRTAILEIKREQNPRIWALIHNNLGNALRALGWDDDDTAKLEQAIDAQRAALLELTRDRNPAEWAEAQNNLGLSLQVAGQRSNDKTMLEQALEAHQAALLELTRERTPMAWAAAQVSMGVTLMILSSTDNDALQLERAVEAFQAALLEWTRERRPLAWAEIQNYLGQSLRTLGIYTNDTIRLEQSVNAHQLALLENTRRRSSQSWALTQNNLGDALLALGERLTGAEHLEAAVEAYTAALDVWTEDRSPMHWARAQMMRSVTLQRLGQKNGNFTRFMETQRDMLSAEQIFARAGQSSQADTVRQILALIESLNQP